MSKYTRYRETLTRLFETVEPDFRRDTIKRYVDLSHQQLATWKSAMNDPEPIPRLLRHHAIRTPEFVCPADKETYRYFATWEGLRDAINDGVFIANTEKATREAEQMVSNAKMAFVSKQAAKLEKATRLRADEPTLDGRLSLQGTVTGYLDVTFVDASFRLKMSMIVNYRYKYGNSSFLQFSPARFTNIVIRGQQPKGNRVSERWMSENFQ